MSLINTASKIEDTYELSDDQLDGICGGAVSQVLRQREAVRLLQEVTLTLI